MTKTEKALALALRAHSTQVRKTDGSPYIIHPIMVANIVMKYSYDEDVVAAALLHDVLEDTSVSAKEIESLVGARSLSIVQAVTEDKALAWEDRKNGYKKTVIAGGESVWLVSVADKVHNAESLLDFIKQTGPTAWQSFNRDKDTKLSFEMALYTELATVWQHPLLDRYSDLISQLQSS